MARHVVSGKSPEPNRVHVGVIASRLILYKYLIDFFNRSSNIVVVLAVLVLVVYSDIVLVPVPGTRS